MCEQPDLVEGFITTSYMIWSDTFLSIIAEFRYFVFHTEFCSFGQLLIFVIFFLPYGE